MWEGDMRREEGSVTGVKFQGPGEPVCPFFKQVAADWLYPVTGYCRGRKDGKLMIPSISEYRTFCTTDRFRLCEHVRERS